MLKLYFKILGKSIKPASDAVAKNLIRDLLGENEQHPEWKGQIPDIINRIAEDDATAVGRELFNTDPQDTAAPPTNAAWSGSLLFTLLGSDQTGRLTKTGVSESPVGCASRTLTNIKH